MNDPRKTRLATNESSAEAKIVEIGVAVVVDRGNVLVGLRDDEAHRGYWEFPGGKLLPGESPFEAAIRECREETGLDVRLLRELTTSEYAYPHRTVRLHFFLAVPATRQSRQKPAAPFTWRSVDELKTLPFLPANAEVVEWLVGHVPLAES
ncbi:NUDIX domain-containing protein [Thermostilla marina]